MYRLARLITQTGCYHFSTNKLPKSRKPLFKPTPQQLKYIEWDSLDDCKLLGIPGSGKTLSILNRVEFLIEEKHMNPEDFHILTFSRFTKHNVLNAINYHNYSHLKTDNVRTMDALARLVLKELERDYQNMNLLSLNFLSLLEEEFDLARPHLHNLKYIFVDEAQDLRKIQIKIINLLREKNGSKVSVVGDPNQSIYKFLGSDSSFLINFPGEPFYLTKNFRSTPNIICFGEHFKNKDCPEYLPKQNTPEEITTEGPLKKSKSKREIEIYTGTSRQVEKKVLKEILKYSNGKNNIGILSPTTKSKWSSNVGLSWAANLLTKHKIPFVKQYKDSGLQYWKIDFSGKPNHINLTTYVGSKGMEWDFVVLLDFSLFKHGKLPTLNEYLDDLNLYYVAATRAKKKLLICHKTDTGLNDEAKGEEASEADQDPLQPLKANVNLNNILDQFREAASPVKKLEELKEKIDFEEDAQEEEEEEEEEEDEFTIDGKRIIRNMIHPLVKTVDPELYESNIKTKSHIKRIKFDPTWLEKERKVEGAMGVTQFISSLNKNALNRLFDDPRFTVETHKERLYEKTDINLRSIQNNETLGGIISEGLVYRNLGLPVEDFIEKVVKQEYLVCNDPRTYSVLQTIIGEKKTWGDLKRMFWQKNINQKEYNFIMKHFDQDEPFFRRFIIDASTHRAILYSLNSIKKAYSYKYGTPKEEESQDFNKALPEEGQAYYLNFYTVYNAILQYAFESKHNDYIIRAWNATTKFLSDNDCYITNLKLLSDNLLQRSLFWHPQVEVRYTSLLKGLIDLVDDNSNIYEIKATRNVTKNHILQVLLYSVMSNPKQFRENREIKSSSSLINLIHGEIHHLKCSISNDLLDDFLESNLSKSERLLKGPLYLYETKIDRMEDRLFVYHLCIKDAKTQENIVNTFIRYTGYVPSSCTQEEFDEYMCAPAKSTVEKSLELLIASKKCQPVFLSLPGCDEKGDGLGSLLPLNSIVIDGEGFLKLVTPNLNDYNNEEVVKECWRKFEDEDSTSRERAEDFVSYKFRLMSKLAFRNSDLLKEYIDESRFCFYL